MSNKKLGILGMGRIGRAVAKEQEVLEWKFIIIIRNNLVHDLEVRSNYHDKIKSLFSSK